MAGTPVRIPVEGGELSGHRAGSGPPAVLLHGGPALPDYTASLASELGTTFMTLRYTQRGVAPSLEDGPCTIEQHRTDVLAAIDALEVERAWLVGHSWGGHLALHVAVAHPERVLGIVAIGTLGADGAVFGPFGDALRQRAGPAGTARLDEIEQRRRDGTVTEAELVERNAIVWPAYFADPATATPAPARVGVRSSREANASIAAHFAAGTLRDGLPAVRLPLLVVHGALDPLPARFAEQTAALVPGSEVRIVAGVAHFPWEERPGCVAAVVEPWLAALANA
jgi:pimeloyl-ACP methyl ester carboxylesterase